MSAPPRPRAAILRRAGSWAGPPADRVALDFDGRHRRRIALRAEGGLALLIDLPEAARLRHGDALELEDGRLVEIAAAAEPLMEVRAPTPAELLRLAWHFGNRHLPTQLLEDRLRVRRDHVIRDLARRLGAETLDIDAPFEPEGGAYGGHGHDHSGAHGAAARGDADRDAPR